MSATEGCHAECSVDGKLSGSVSSTEDEMLSLWAQNDTRKRGGVLTIPRGRST